MKTFTTYLLLVTALLSCNGQSPEITAYTQTLNDHFKNYSVEVEKIETNKNGELEIYFGKDSENVLNYLKNREAAILLIDQHPRIAEMGKIYFKFITNHSNYFDITFNTDLLSQTHTKTLLFENPTRCFKMDFNHDENPTKSFAMIQQKTIDRIGNTAGKGTSDGDSYCYPEAGFSFYKNQSITYYARGTRGHNQYEKDLPYKIKFSMTKRDIIALLGEPENDSRVYWEFKNKEIGILFKDDKILKVEQLEKQLAAELREKYPVKKNE